MNRQVSSLATIVVMALALAACASSAVAAEPPCDLEPRARCFGIASVSASLSTTQAGGHPDLGLDVAIKQDPTSDPNPFGLKDSYGPTRNIRFNSPPGLIGDPNVLGVPQQCTVQELVGSIRCPNGSQVGVATISAYQINQKLREPVYMMQPPGGDVVARLGTVAGTNPTFIDFRVRSEGDYGLVAEVRDAPALAKLIVLESTFWGVPAHPSHNNERCTPPEVLLEACVVSPSRPPGSRPLPFLTNPTRCGVPLTMGVNASSWAESSIDPSKEVTTSFPTISGCNRLPFGPTLTLEPTSRRPASPTGLDVTLSLPASDYDVPEPKEVLEPAQLRDIRVSLPEGLVSNPSVGDGLEACSDDQVNLGERTASECPDAAKLADTEFEVAALSRRMRGAIYLREPVPGDPFRIWVVADDLGAHVKLPGRLDLDKATGQIESVVLDAPQVPLREVKLLFKSGFRAPLVTPSSCGTFPSKYRFDPWSGGLPVIAETPMTIDLACGGLNGFSPKIEAGTTDPTGGRHSPFVFTLTREEGEQNPAGLDIALPPGLAATFGGIPRCEGADAVTGACPAAARIGKVMAAVGAGPVPLWIPQPGKRATAVYLGGPYKGGPLSIVAVVPRQAGPFDFGDEVVRSALYVDPTTGQATAKADPLPQIIEGIPIGYRTLHVELDRPGFTLNPTSCKRKSVDATVTSSQGAIANPSSPFAAVNCARLPFKPRLIFELRGGTHRGDHPRLRAVLKGRSGDANIAGASVALPRSEFLDQGHIRTICTRVQFAAGNCPAGSIYGRARAKTPLFEEALSGPVYLRSSNNPLPDMVVALRGPDSLPVEIDLVGRIDSVNGGIRSTFKVVPDAPVSSFVLEMRGGNRGLLVNSTNLCARVQRATAELDAQNGKALTLRPEMRVSCPGK